MKKLLRCTIILYFSLLLPQEVFAHALAPSFVTIKENTDGIVHVNWKLSTIGPQQNIQSVQLSLGNDCKTLEASPFIAGQKSIRRTIKLDCGISGLTNKLINFTGLSQAQHSIITRIIRADNSEIIEVLSGANSQIIIRKDNTTNRPIFRYLTLGMNHILDGFDHLVFVLCLVLLTLPSLKQLFIGITIFTVAHSVTLSLAALNIIGLPALPVESLIALSITLLAAEVFKKAIGKETEKPLKTFVIQVFIFGLLHGMGFAGALSEIGLPKTDYLWALAAFNLGVEAGQILFVVQVYGIGAILLTATDFVRMNNPHFIPRAKLIIRTQFILSASASILASYWFIDRTSSMFS